MSIRTIILVALLAAQPVYSSSISISSGTDQVGLLELYTSEGCSSCPPADRWITALEDNAQLWRQFVPIAFHVDYWDYIGWKDRFASSDYSQRQQRHALEQMMHTVYTPGVFYNGREWRNWRSGPGSVPGDGSKVGELKLEIENQTARVEFDPATPLKTSLQASVVLLGFDIATQVKAGENVGRELKHNFVVLGHETMLMQEQDGRYVISMQLPTSNEDAPRYAVAAWVNRTALQQPIQAVGGWLN